MCACLALVVPLAVVLHGCGNEPPTTTTTTPTTTTPMSFRAISRGMIEYDFEAWNINVGWDGNKWVHETILPTDFGSMGSEGCLVFSPDGQRALVGWKSPRAESPYSLTVWGTGEDPTSWESLRVLGNHPGYVMSASWSPDGLRAVSGGKCASTDGACPIMVWNVADPDPLQWALVGELEGYDGDIHSVSFAPDGQRVISGGKHPTIKVWNITGDDPEKWVRLKELQLSGFDEEDAVNSVAFSPDGLRAISGTDLVLTVWNVGGQPAGWGELKRWDWHDRGSAPPSFQTASFSSDGSRVISAGKVSPGVVIYNITGNDPDEWLLMLSSRSHGRSGDARSAGFSCNDQCFYVLDIYGVQFWNTAAEDVADWQVMVATPDSYIPEWAEFAVQPFAVQPFAVQPPDNSRTDLNMDV